MTTSVSSSSSTESQGEDGMMSSTTEESEMEETGEAMPTTVGASGESSEDTAGESDTTSMARGMVVPGVVALAGGLIGVLLLLLA